MIKHRIQMLEAKRKAKKRDGPPKRRTVLFAADASEIEKVREAFMKTAPKGTPMAAVIYAKNCKIERRK